MAETQRLDKWLWFARVVKTRTMAAGLVAGGKVRVNRQRVGKPSHTIRAGDVVTVAAHSRVRVLRIMAAGQRRGPPAEAAGLYEELTPGEPRGAARPALERSAPGGERPTKRDRRALDRLMESAGEDD